MTVTYGSSISRLHSMNSHDHHSGQRKAFFDLLQTGSAVRGERVDVLRSKRWHSAPVQKAVVHETLDPPIECPPTLVGTTGNNPVLETRSVGCV